MSQILDTPTLEQDARLDEPLRRVAYEAGMLLGLEATRDEQEYHRRRLTRHQYWFQGFGTLAGMAVRIDPPSAPGTDPVTVRVIVGPGVGIDGFGREVLVHEPYCIDLGDWLKAQSETHLREGYDEAANPNLLWLKVTVRYQDCPVAAQPVLARKLNLSTDATQPSRTADSVLLELAAELPPAAPAAGYQPWGARPPIANALPALSPAEQAVIDAAPNAAARRQLEMQARLLHALDDVSLNPQSALDELAEGAQLLLARLSIVVPDLDVILNADDADEVTHPGSITVNNMARPFMTTASQAAFHLRNA
jgi:hypothetical protein